MQQPRQSDRDPKKWDFYLQTNLLINQGAEVKTQNKFDFLGQFKAFFSVLIFPRQKVVIACVQEMLKIFAILDLFCWWSSSNGIRMLDELFSTLSQLGHYGQYGIVRHSWTRKFQNPEFS